MSKEPLPCGCIPDASGYGYCTNCTTALRLKIWKGMSHEQRQYDRHFAPDASDELDRGLTESTGCSCHINPPCSYCTSKSEEDYE